MLLSIVTGTHNRLPYLTAMINSCFAGKPADVEYEFCICAEACTDGTIEYLKKRTDVKLVLHENLTGAINAFNTAAALATGDYLLIANDDVEFYGDSVIRGLSFMARSPEVGAGCFYQNRGGKPMHVEYMQVTEANKSRGTQIFMQVGIVPRWLWEKCGGWGNFGAWTYAGDTHLSIKILEMGFQIVPISGCSIDDKTPADALRKLNTSKLDEDIRKLNNLYPHGATLPSRPTEKSPLEVLYIPFGKRAKIHLLCLFSVRLDSDLIPFFIEHYKKLELDFYTVHLHLSGVEELDFEAHNVFLQHGFTVVPVPFADTLERPETAYAKAIPKDAPITLSTWPGAYKAPMTLAYIKTMPKEDYLLPVDSDEFQMWETSPHDVAVSGVDFVRGVFVDRFDRRLKFADRALTLEENFPYTHENLPKHLGVNLANTKIVLTLPHVPIDYSGAHEEKKIAGAHYKEWPHIIPVHHVRWRPNIKERIEHRFYTPPDYAKKVLGFFDYAHVTQIVWCAPDKKLGDFALKLPALQALRQSFNNPYVIGIGYGLMETAKELGLVDEIRNMDTFVNEQCPVHGADFAVLFGDGMDVYTRRILSKYGTKKISSPMPWVGPDKNLPLAVQFYKHAITFGMFPAEPCFDLSPLVSGNSPEGNPKIYLHAGSAENFKKFGSEVFIKITNGLKLIADTEVVIILGPEEKKDVDTVYAAAGLTVWRPKSVMDLMRKIKGARAYFGLDSGGTHIASLMAVPTFFLYASMPNVEWHPTFLKNAVMLNYPPAEIVERALGAFLDKELAEIGSIA